MRTCLILAFKPIMRSSLPGLLLEALASSLSAAFLAPLESSTTLLAVVDDGLAEDRDDDDDDDSEVSFDLDEEM